jgi:hypothetical protein
MIQTDLAGEGVDRVLGRFDTYGADLSQIKSDLAEINEYALEDRYRMRAPAYFGRLVRHIRVLDQTALDELLDDAVAEGRLSESERIAVLQADLVLTGRRTADQEAVYVVVEISAGVGRSDVERAADRAAVLAKLGRPAIPAVAGHSANPEAQALARERNVAVVLNGRTES